VAKIFIEVTTPGNGKTYEFRLDNFMTVGQAKQRIIDEILELEGDGLRLSYKDTKLFNVATRLPLSEISHLASSSVRSGHQLLLL